MIVFLQEKNNCAILFNSNIWQTCHATFFATAIIQIKPYNLVLEMDACHWTDTVAYSVQ